MCPFRRALKAAVRFSFAFCLIYLFIIIQPQHLTKSSVNSAFVHCSWIHKFHFSETFLLKMGLTILFTHLKIILLQCFQFQFSVSATISSIQTNPYNRVISCGSSVMCHIKLLGYIKIILSCHAQHSHNVCVGIITMAIKKI